MRIVIVEDHPMILQVLTAALKTVPGYVVQGYGTARDGLEACGAGADLAIFDNRLPDMTGTEAVRLLRATPVTRHLPIIMITGDGDARTRMDSIKAGATDFLEKPVNIDELRLRVRNLLALHEAQKQAERRERLLESIIATSDASIAVADARNSETPFTFVSDALARLLGRDAREMVEQNHPLLWIDAAPSDALDALQAAVTSRSAGRFVVQAHRQGGGDFWNEVTLHPVPDPGQGAHYLVVTQRDITDMVEIREAHDKLNARMSDIARISGAWFFEVDAQARISYVSEAMALALGARVADVVGTPVDAINARFADPLHADKPLSSVLAPPHRLIEGLLLTFDRPGKSPRSVQVSMVPYDEPGVGFGGFRGHAVDVSEIAFARDRADRASRAKSAFLATMSHEMRTPLTAIVGLSETLSMEISNPEHREQLGTIQQEAGHLAQVLGDVLDVATMERGTLTLGSAAFDPVAIAHDAVDALCDAGRSKGLRMQLDIVGEPHGLRIGDGPRLRQILRNLVSNAVKFTDTGTVTMTLDLTAPNAVRFSVADTGIGMDESVLSRVLQPFVQADDGIARIYGGSGLGLSLAQFLCRAMGGTLTLRSRPGLGTEALIDVPLQRQAPRAATPPDLANRRILVADDNRANRKILEVMLKKLGAEVILAEDGKQALDLWEGAGPFDLMALDINMPHLAGTDVALRVRQDGLGAAIPLLAVTANAAPEQVSDYFAVGFDGCLGKPFTLDALSQALNGVLANRPLSPVSLP